MNLFLPVPEQNLVRASLASGTSVQGSSPLCAAHEAPENRSPHEGGAVIATVARSTSKPGLVFFYSPVSGACRRVEGFLAQVLQRRRNHGTFKLYRVDEEERPDLVERFRVERMPTLFVVENKTVRAKLERPRGCREIESFLGPWLQ